MLLSARAGAEVGVVTALMLALCWLPPLVHGWWLLARAVARRVDVLLQELTTLHWAVDRWRP